MWYPKSLRKQRITFRLTYDPLHFNIRADVFLFRCMWHYVICEINWLVTFHIRFLFLSIPMSYSDLPPTDLTSSTRANAAVASTRSVPRSHFRIHVQTQNPTQQRQYEADIRQEQASTTSKLDTASSPLRVGVHVVRNKRIKLAITLPNFTASHPLTNITNTIPNCTA
jgi:hypothetical protein